MIWLLSGRSGPSGRPSRLRSRRSFRGELVAGRWSWRGVRCSGTAWHRAGRWAGGTAGGTATPQRSTPASPVSTGFCSQSFPGASAGYNAVAESFFATIKTELLDRRAWPTRAVARTAIFDWIEGGCNTRRRHSTLGCLGPSEHEETAYSLRVA
ncbi:integrase core domain-containing protein [Micromonospora sp. SH-82]|uniref:integrase core domain-containing protein n=1 Tax=Micromonospora sp. SH-82 TaxID=3132938 RepID=UPI003EBCD266